MNRISSYCQVTAAVAQQQRINVVEMHDSIRQSVNDKKNGEYEDMITKYRNLFVSMAVTGNVRRGENVKGNLSSILKTYFFPFVSISLTKIIVFLLPLHFSTAEKSEHSSYHALI